jgi:hypothetical protein
MNNKRKMKKKKKKVKSTKITQEKNLAVIKKKKKEMLQSKFICRSGKLSSSAKPWGCCNQAAGCVSPGKGRDLLPKWNVKS